MYQPSAACAEHVAILKMLITIGKHIGVNARSVLTNITERPGTAASAGSNQSTGAGGRKSTRTGHVRMSQPRRSSLTHHSEADALHAGAQ